MAVRFIIGRSGSGKSHYCIDNACTELAKTDFDRRLIFLTPEQATFQVEQAILKDGRINGYNNLEVTSFIRLAKKASSNMPVNSLSPLSKTGRRLLLFRMLNELKDDLKIFASEITPGFCDQVSQILSEMHRYDKSPSDLLDQYDKLLEENSNSNGPLAAKLHDLAVIQRYWQEKVQGKYLDPDKYLDYLAEYFQEHQLSPNTIIWIDGFAGFTPQQFKLMKIFMEQAGLCNVCLNLDPDSEQFSCAGNPDYKLEETNIFHPTLDTYQRLTAVCLNNGIKIEEPIVLPESAAMPRFSPGKTLANIEKYIFSDTKPAAPANDTETALEIVHASNQREEISAAARKILQLCREKQYRLSEIAIIVRDLDGNEELLASILEEHNIPYFMDNRRDVRHHPLIELVQSVFEMLTDNFRIDAIFDYLKTDLCPITRSQADALENYCITTGVFGSQWLNQEPWNYSTREFPSSLKQCKYQTTVSEIDELRRKAIAPLLAMKNAISSAGKTPGVKIITRELMHLIIELEVAQKLQQWQNNAIENGNLEDQEIHSQVYSDFIDILNELVAALDDFPVSLNEYTEILFSAIKEMSLRLVPPSLDQVVVGTIERSRQPAIKAAFILGMNDGNFPRYNASTAILTDRQREILCDNDFEVAPPAGVKLLHEKYLAYIAFTRSSEYLWVSFSSGDQNDKALNESPFIRDLQKSCGKQIITRIYDSRSSADHNRITNNEQLARELTAALADARDTNQIDPIWQSLYHKFKDTALPEITLAGLSAENKASLQKELAEKLTGSGKISSSISRLEEYAKCPFKYFSNYMLRLYEREPFALEAVDLGNYYHEILCEMFRMLKAQNSNWHNLDEAEIPELVERASSIVCETNQEIKKLLEKNSRNNFIFARARKDLVKIAVTITQSAKVSDFRQTEAEVVFGSKNQDIPGLLVNLSKNLTLELNGKIDRIDTMVKDGKKSVAVYDYKLSDREFDWVKFYYGIELQLACYLLIAAEYFSKEKMIPAGMFFMKTTPEQQKDSESEIPDSVLDGQLNENEPLAASGVKANGIFDASYAKNLENSLKQYSCYYKGLRMSAKGEINGSSPTTDEALNSVLAYSKHILATLALEMSDGNINITPFRLKNNTPCQMCPYDPVCQFDKALNSFKEIPDIPTGEVQRLIINKIEKE